MVNECQEQTTTPANCMLEYDNKTKSLENIVELQQHAIRAGEWNDIVMPKGNRMSASIQM